MKNPNAMSSIEEQENELRRLEERHAGDNLKYLPLIARTLLSLRRDIAEQPSPTPPVEQGTERKEQP